MYAKKVDRQLAIPLLSSLSLTLAIPLLPSLSLTVHEYILSFGEGEASQCMSGLIGLDIPVTPSWYVVI